MIQGTHYQRTSLAALQSLDVATMKARLFAEVGLAHPPPPPSPRVGEEEEEATDYTMVVYGELMINKHLFDYPQRQLGSGWYAFGAILRHKGESPMNAMVARARRICHLCFHP
jgi:hypothetical protein